jgi:hypothetical protein
LKHQYFGDINDYRKYGLLRLLMLPDRLRLGLCWMLTPPDDRGDGLRLTYLKQASLYRPCDPELFDWLERLVAPPGQRSAFPVETSSLLGAEPLFQHEWVPDDPERRADYFRDTLRLFADCDLVFFDPDNGLEVKSIPRGRKGSNKYLFWDEVKATYELGVSVLIFQFYRRESHPAFASRLASELGRCAGAAAVFTFRTPFVLFLLAAQAGHAAGLRSALPVIAARWGTGQISAVEHCQTADQVWRPVI